jgi:lysozyme family protein
MTAANFSKSMSRVLVYEGGFSHHPKDPGGATLEGITQRVDDAYRQRNGLPPRALSAALRSQRPWLAERDAIYRQQYWDRIRGDELPAGIDFVVFDAAVNSGPVQAVKWLQRALGLALVDGMLGEATLAAVEANLDHDKLVADICGRRLAFMQALSTWSTFGAGWSRRVSSAKAIGQAWATGSVGPQPVAVADLGGAAKAHEVSLPQAPVSVGAGASAATGGTVTVGALDPLQQASSAITPLADSITIAKYVVLAITVVIAGVTLFGLYRNWKAQRAKDGRDVAAIPELA